MSAKWIGFRRCVYLIHFDSPIGNRSNPRAQAQHYIGYSDHLPSRLADHMSGRGAKIMAAVVERGIGWSVVRTWSGCRSLERILKNHKKASDLCPICKANKKEKDKWRSFLSVSDTSEKVIHSFSLRELDSGHNSQCVPQTSV